MNKGSYNQNKIKLFQKWGLCGIFPKFGVYGLEALHKFREKLGKLQLISFFQSLHITK